MGYRMSRWKGKKLAGDGSGERDGRRGGCVRRLGRVAVLEKRSTGGSPFGVVRSRRSSEQPVSIVAIRTLVQFLEVFIWWTFQLAFSAITTSTPSSTHRRATHRG